MCLLMPLITSVCLSCSAFNFECLDLTLTMLSIVCGVCLSRQLLDNGGMWSFTKFTILVHLGT